MYAVIRAGGKQYKVSQGDLVKVEKIHQEPGTEISFDVMMLGGGENGIKIGKPVVEGAAVKAKIRREGRHPKIWSFKKWSGPWKKIRGHRQDFTEIEITSIEA